jgi:hypothetical protein
VQAKKLQHPVPFFAPEKMAVSRPALPRIPTQTHHKNITSYTVFLKKPQQKPHSTTANKFCLEIHRDPTLEGG